MLRKNNQLKTFDECLEYTQRGSTREKQNNSSCSLYITAKYTYDEYTWTCCNKYGLKSG